MVDWNVFHTPAAACQSRIYALMILSAVCGGECQHIIFDRSVRLSNNIPERLLYHQCMMKSAVVCKFANPFFTLRLVLKQIYCGSY